MFDIYLPYFCTRLKTNEINTFFYKNKSIFNQDEKG